jgi:hypothetical protein
MIDLGHPQVFLRGLFLKGNFFMETIRPTGWIISSATIAWVMTLILVILAFRYGRGVLEAFLMKMHEFFIQRSPVRL